MASSVLYICSAWPWNSHALEYVHHSEIRKFYNLLRHSGCIIFFCFQYFVDFKLNTNGTIADVNEYGVEAATSNGFEDINYATNFLAYIGFASQIPNVIFNWLNIFINMG